MAQRIKAKEAELARKQQEAKGTEQWIDGTSYFIIILSYFLIHKIQPTNQYLKIFEVAASVAEVRETALDARLRLTWRGRVVDVGDEWMQMNLGFCDGEW